MSARYVVHPMEQKFRDDMVAQAKRNAFIKEVYDECEELGITDPSRMFNRAFHMGEYYARQEAQPQVKVQQLRTYEEWLDTKIGEHDGAILTMRHLISEGQHYVGRMIYEALMKEIAK